MAIVYAKTENAKYATRTNYFNIIHISVPADRIVTSWLDMCYTMHALSRVTVKSEIL